MADTKQATPELEHSMNCPERNPMSEEACTCGLYWRIALQTEQTMHAAWRKRAEEAESALASRSGPDRGQQDAPGVEVDGIGRFSIMLKKGETLTDIADELAHVAEQAVMPPLETHVEALQITMKFAADKLRQFMAKAAREGQDATQMLLRIRATLQSRAEGHNTGGDIEVMKAVDAIVAREAPKGKST